MDWNSRIYTMWFEKGKQDPYNYYKLVSKHRQQAMDNQESDELNLTCEQKN